MRFSSKVNSMPTEKRAWPLLRWCAAVLLALMAGYAAPILAACSAYQGNTNWGGTSGGTGAAGSGNTTGYIATLNEYYFGNAPNFIEVTVTDLNGSGSGPAPISVWQNWGVQVQSKSGQTVTTRRAALNQAAVTACYEGQVTYFWLPVGAFSGSGNFPQDSEVLLYDNAGTWTQAIDMLFWKNAAALPALYSDPGCTNLTTVGYNGYLYGRPYQTGQLFGSLGNKDLVRVPNAVGTWAVSGASNGPAASGTTPVVSGTPVIPGPILACSTSPSNDGISVKKNITTSPTTGLAPGASVGFSVVVKNQTTTAQAVTVTDTLPTGMTYFAGSAVSTPAGNLTSFPPTWITPSLAAGASATLTFNATVNSNVPDGSSLTNTASAPLPSSALTATSSAGVTNIVNPLTMTKTVDNAAPAVGQTVTFTVTVTNKQSPAPTSITITDVFPSSPGIWNWAVTPSAGSYSAGVWTITGIGNAPLGGQTTATLTATATVPSDATGTYTNTAQMTAVSPAEPNLALPLSATSSFTVTPAVSSFNAFQTGTPALAITGNIYTKLAGVAAGLQSGADGLDVVAISAGAQATGFNGNVKLELLANSTPGLNYGGTNPNCPNTFSIIQTVASTAIAGGRSTVNFAAVADAYRDVRVRISYPTSSPTVTTCSTDSFSIRPQAFTLTSTNATQTGTSGAPAIKTGANFNLTAASVAGYDGTPVIDNTKVVGTPTAGAIEGTFGAAPAGTGTATGSSFTYSEVGNFGLNANAVYDSSFTSIDQPGDCTADFSSSLVGGKYGCSIGSTAVPQTTGSSGFGRFVPDHFTVVATITNACAAGAFTYMGQSFTLSTANVVEARNTAEAVTANYAGAYPLGTVSFGAENADNGTDLSARLTFPLGSWISGIYTLASTSASFARPTTGVPDATWGSYESLDIGLAVNDNDPDATILMSGADMNPSGAGVGPFTYKKFSGSPLRMRFGRLRLLNAYGSELLDVGVPLRAEFYTGTGWNLNSADSCTALPTSSFFTSGALAPVIKSASPITLSGGGGTLIFNKTAATGSFDLAANLNAAGTDTSCNATHGGAGANMSWLQGFWAPAVSCNTTPAWEQDPNARIKFGSPRAPYIYLRERY